jgi:Ribonuclease G/E
MRVIVAEHVGETRAALYDNDRAIEIHLERWSERGARAVRGEVYRGRVRAVDRTLGGCFVDLGRGPEGFLPLSAAGDATEGAAVGVQIVREAFQAKGPTLTPFEVEPGDAPAVVHPAPPVWERLARAFDAPVKSDREAGVDLDAAVDEALDPVVRLSGGGRLIIEPTAALTAIDVDAADRTGAGGPKFAADLNKAAAREAARQIRLRNIGGVCAIDFLPSRKKTDQSQLFDAVKAAFKKDPAKVDIAPPSRFAIVELARQRLGRALHEIALDADRRPTPETRALAALRALAREGQAQRARKLALHAAPDVARWLESASFDWRRAMTDRLGPRFSLVEAPAHPPGAYEVKHA